MRNATDNANPSNATKRYLTPKIFAEELGIAEQTAAKWRCTGVGPPFIRMGKAIRYSRETVDAWIRSRTVTNTSQPNTPVGTVEHSVR